MNDIVVYKDVSKRYNLRKPDGGYLYTNLDTVGIPIMRMRAGYSPIILICGGQRIGKSFVAVWLANIIANFFHNKNFEPKKNTFYDPLESIKRIGEVQRNVILIDEAGSVLNKQEWYDRVVKALDRIIQTQGYLCNCYILVSPFGSDIAKTFRKHFDFQIFVRRKGIFVFRKLPKKYADMTDAPIKPFRLEQVVIKHNDIPEKVWCEYESFSFKQKENLRISAYKSAKKRMARDKKTDFFGRVIQ